MAKVVALVAAALLGASAAAGRADGVRGGGYHAGSGGYHQYTSAVPVDVDAESAARVPFFLSPVPIIFNYDVTDVALGPTNWGALTGAEDCDGSLQSPVNLVADFFVAGGEFEMHLAGQHVPAASFLLFPDNLGLAIYGRFGVTHAAGVLTGYEMTGVEFHTPSLHRIGGQQYAAEAVFWHRHQMTGELAAISVLYQVGHSNHAFEELLKYVPGDQADTTVSYRSVIRSVQAHDLLHRDFFGDYFVYEGSMPYPPCHEGVRWIVAKNAAYISAAQLAEMQFWFGGNARPVQDTNGRRITLVNLEVSVSSFDTSSSPLDYHPRNKGERETSSSVDKPTIDTESSQYHESSNSYKGYKVVQHAGYRNYDGK